MSMTPLPRAQQRHPAHPPLSHVPTSPCVPGKDPAAGGAQSAGARAGEDGEGAVDEEGEGEGEKPTLAQLTALVEKLQDRLQVDHLPSTALHGVKYRLQDLELQLLRDKAFLERLVRCETTFSPHVVLNLMARRLLCPRDIVVHLCFNDEALSEEVIDVRGKREGGKGGLCRHGASKCVCGGGGGVLGKRRCCLPCVGTRLQGCGCVCVAFAMDSPRRRDVTLPLSSPPPPPPSPHPL